MRKSSCVLVEVIYQEFLCQTEACRLHPSTLSDSATSLRFPSAIPGVQHHWTAGIAPTTSIARKGAVAGARVMAASIIHLLTSPELRAAAKKQFEEDTKEIKYFSLLPPGAKPPVDLNHEMMDKYRPAMRKFYLNRKAEFK